MKILSVVLILLVILIGAIGIYYFAGNTQINTSQNVSENYSTCTSSRGINDTCWIELAVRNKDSSYCTNVSGRYNSGNAPNCFKQVYIATEDAESCGKLYYTDDRNECYYKISKNKGKEICNSITNVSIDGCKSGIFIGDIIDRATITKNQTICNELIGEYTIYPDLVSNYSAYREQCLTRVFVSIGDINLCEQLVDYKEGCIYQIQNK